MIFRKIASNIRVDSNTEIFLKPSSGGRMVKTAGYMIRLTSASDAAAKVGLKLYHGPNGVNKILHSTPIALATAAELMVGDSSAGDVMLFEYLHASLIGDTTASKWVNVDVYEMLKPF